MKFLSSVNINLLSIPLLLLTLLLVQLNTTNATYKTITYQETVTTNLKGWAKQSYSREDGSAILQFVKLISTNCSQPQLYLRILHPNGTITPLDFDFSLFSPQATPKINDFNFCLAPYGGTFIDVVALKEDYLLISYLDLFDGVTYQRNGIIVDWNKQIIGYFFFCYFF